MRRLRAMKKLYLSDTDRKIGGVCGGLGEYFEKDSNLFRILFILITLLFFVFRIIGCFGIIGYIVMWLIIPKKPKQAD